MGLDQYGYKIKKAEYNTDFSFDVEDEEDEVLIAQWRKHPYLQGWMEKLYNVKANAQNYVGQLEDAESDFNVELTAMGPEGVIDLNPDPEVLDKIKEALEHAKKEMIMQSLVKNVNKAPQRIFNCQPIRLSISDLDQLEMAIKLNELPESHGFFWGDNSSEEYKEEDLKFVEDARQAIRDGYDVYYNSWW